ncbi:MAG: methyltransferase family protein, partial [Terriglobia bacterium]
ALPLAGLGRTLGGTKEAMRMSLEVLWEVLLYGWVAGEVVIAIATRSRGSQGKVQDQGTQLLIWVVIVLSFWAKNRVGFARTDIHLSHEALRIAGFVLIVGGLAVRIIAIVTLGRSFSANVAIHHSQTVQRQGLYSFVRHPSYLGMEIIFVAVGLHSHNWAALGIIVILPTLAVLYRIHVEEAALLGAFGTGYADYMRSTKRLIPGVY